MLVFSKLSLELAALEPILALKWFKPDFKSSNLNSYRNKHYSKLKSKSLNKLFEITLHFDNFQVRIA
jgi:hypothetical protein